MSLDEKIEQRVRALLHECNDKETFLDKYFTDWYYLESIDIKDSEFMHIQECMHEKGYYKGKIKTINKYVYVYADYCITLWK